MRHASLVAAYEPRRIEYAAWHVACGPAAVDIAELAVVGVSAGWRGAARNDGAAALATEMPPNSSVVRPGP